MLKQIQILQEATTNLHRPNFADLSFRSSKILWSIVKKYRYLYNSDESYKGNAWEKNATQDNKRQPVHLSCILPIGSIDGRSA